jgi:hypothetical protein
VKVLFVDNVKVPAPTLVRLPAPEIIPEISSLPASPVVNVIPVSSSTAPEPLNELIVSVVSTSYVPELMTSTSSCNVPDTVTVPAEMVKSPVKVFVPPKVKVPAPVLVMVTS